MTSRITYFLVVAAVSLLAWAASRGGAWTPAQIEQLQSLTISQLGPVPPDPSNRVADDPRAVALGHRLFFDTRLSSNGKVSCATYHMPDREFQDGRPLANGVGTTDRRTMPVAGTAYSPFLFWDGRKDSLWAQALGPLESPVEHGGTREQYAQVIARHYRDDYERIFGPLPVFPNRQPPSVAQSLPCPHGVIAPTSTRSPTSYPATPASSSAMTPTGSCPMTSPGRTGYSAVTICRSIPQIVVVVTRISASPGPA